MAHNKASPKANLVLPTMRTALQATTLQTVNSPTTMMTARKENTTMMTARTQTMTKTTGKSSMAERTFSKEVTTKTTKAKLPAKATKAKLPEVFKPKPPVIIPKLGKPGEYVKMAPIELDEFVLKKRSHMSKRSMSDKKKSPKHFTRVIRSFDDLSSIKSEASIVEITKAPETSEELRHLEQMRLAVVDTEPELNKSLSSIESDEYELMEWERYGRKTPFDMVKKIKAELKPVTKSKLLLCCESISIRRNPNYTCVFLLVLMLLIGAVLSFVACGFDEEDTELIYTEMDDETATMSNNWTGNLTRSAFRTTGFG